VLGQSRTRQLAFLLLALGALVGFSMRVAAQAVLHLPARAPPVPPPRRRQKA